MNILQYIPFTAQNRRRKLLNELAGQRHSNDDILTDAEKAEFDRVIAALKTAPAGKAPEKEAEKAAAKTVCSGTAEGFGSKALPNLIRRRNSLPPRKTGRFKLAPERICLYISFNSPKYHFGEGAPPLNNRTVCNIF